MFTTAHSEEEIFITEDIYEFEPGKMVTVRVTVNDCRLEEQYADIALPPFGPQQQPQPEALVVLARPRRAPVKAKAKADPNKMMVVKVRR